MAFVVCLSNEADEDRDDFRCGEGPKEEDVDHIARMTRLVAAKVKARVWIEWVDSLSNPADGHSRKRVQDAWT